MIADDARAVRIAQVIGDAPAQPAEGIGYTVARRSACATCPPAACSICGVSLPGDVFIISHQVIGKRHLSDKAVHYMSHGVCRYQTGYVYRGEPVVVDLNLSELEGYLNLG
jgi:hypothetical protein